MLPTNLTLIENRAKVVMNKVIAAGIIARLIVTAFIWAYVII
jgi:hypothetical protein